MLMALYDERVNESVTLVLEDVSIIQVQVRPRVLCARLPANAGHSLSRYREAAEVEEITVRSAALLQWCRVQFQGAGI